MLNVAEFDSLTVMNVVIISFGVSFVTFLLCSFLIAILFLWTFNNIAYGKKEKKSQQKFIKSCGTELEVSCKKEQKKPNLKIVK